MSANARPGRVQPACCRCNWVTCEADTTGDHCIMVGCAWCVHGCPAGWDQRCCQDAP